MFGYVRAARPELTVRLDGLYRGIYCGLCRAIGRCTGQCARMTLSYDMVFLYLVRASVLKLKPQFAYGRCALHPLRRRLFLQPDEALRYAAKANALLFYGKLRDDLADERGARRMLLRLLKFPAHRAVRRAGLPALEAEIAAHLSELSTLEAEQLPSVDAPADLFGRLLSAVFSHDLPQKEAAIAREIGFRTGRWIYTLDAADDMERDAKHGAYNPFLRLYGETLDADRRSIVEMTLRYDLKAAANAYALCSDEGDGDLAKITQNILYLGMPQRAHDVLGHGKGEELEQESI